MDAKRLIVKSVEYCREKGRTDQSSANQAEIKKPIETILRIIVLYLPKHLVEVFLLESFCQLWLTHRELNL
jgi:hypothetical protein